MSNSNDNSGRLEGGAPVVELRSQVGGGVGLGIGLGVGFSANIDGSYGYSRGQSENAGVASYGAGVGYYNSEGAEAGGAVGVAAEGAQAEVPQIHIDLNYPRVEEDYKYEEDNFNVNCCKTLSLVMGIIVACVGVVFLFPFMLGYSYKVIEPLYYGIAVDGNTYSILGDKLYENGRYYLGLNNYFLTFPKSNLMIQRIKGDTKSLSGSVFYDNSIKMRTNEGIYLDLEFIVNFKLGTTTDYPTLLKQLIDLYKNFKYDYHSYVSITLEQVAKNVASQFPADDFFAKRLIVQQSIKDQLIQELQPRHFSVTSAMIIGVRYSTTVKINMQYKETANQYIQGLKYKVQSSQIQALTAIEVANVNSDTIIQQAQINSQAYLKDNLGEVLGMKTKLQNLIDALTYAKKNFKFKDTANRSAAEQLIAYYWIKIMQNKGNSGTSLKMDLFEDLK